MTLTRAALVFCVASAAVLVAAAQQPQYRSGTHTVSVYATVLDAAGRLVANLTRDDFEVYDNGVRRELTVFANTTQPITVVVMLDRSGSVREHYGLVRRAADAFVRQLLPDDKARIGSFSDGVRIDPASFTSDREELLRILREELLDTGPTPLWNATAPAIDALATEEGRRVVLVFTDGKDAPGPLPRAATFGDVRDRVEAEEIMVYAIGLSATCPPPVRIRTPRTATLEQRGGRPPQRPPISGPRFPIPLPLPLPPIGPRFPPTGTPPIDPRAPSSLSACRSSGPDPGLKVLAEAGGGGFFELTDAADLDATFHRVADELHQQYLLGFDAPARDGRVHRLDVRLRRSDLTARARTSYVAPRVP